jgi:hypothetical protein
MIIRRPPLLVLVAVWVLLACSALLVIACGMAVAFGIFSDDPFASTGLALGAFLLLPAAVFFVAARGLGHGSRAAWIVSLFLAVNLATSAVGKDETGAIDGISATAGAILIVSLLWPATIRYVWQRPERASLLATAGPTSDRRSPEEP